MRWEKIYPHLDEAVRALIGSNDALHDRLDAAINALAALSEDHFPPTIQKEYRQLMNDIHQYRDSGDRPELQVKLALAIYSLFKHFMVEGWPPNTPLEQV